MGPPRGVGGRTRPRSDEGGPGPGRGAAADRLTSQAGRQAEGAGAMLQFLVRLRRAVAAPPFRGGAERGGGRGGGLRRRAGGGGGGAARGRLAGAGGGGGAGCAASACGRAASALSTPGDRVARSCEHGVLVLVVSCSFSSPAP